MSAPRPKLAYPRTVRLYASDMRAIQVRARDTGETVDEVIRDIVHEALTAPIGGPAAPGWRPEEVTP